ncbi:MAG: hypothetical protein EBV77_08555 [Gemmatimonadaceae bacterium]|nr:hypothetical protein [Gemmatimonadaceae bacterium]
MSTGTLRSSSARTDSASRIEDIPKQEREIRTQLIARTRKMAALKAADSPFAPSTVTPNLPVGSGPVTGSAAPSPASAGAAQAVPAPSSAAPAAAPRASAGGASAAGASASPAGTPAAAARPGAARAAGDSARPQTGFQQRGPSYGELIGNKGGLTPLLFAVREGNVEAVARLLEAGSWTRAPT